MDTMRQLQERFENRHAYARKWKEETGGKVMGYFCTYVPEEILYSANILPVRILGDHTPQTVTEGHLFAMYCPFCRDCLAQGLQGKYDYLDGLMISQSCIHIRQSFNSWVEHVPIEFHYRLPMPHGVQNKAAVPFFREELAKFKNAVEEWTGKPIDDAAILRGIEIVNKNRRLMRQVYDLRRQEAPPLTGLESMYMVLASQTGEKESHSRLLEEALANELAGPRLKDRNTGTRLMIIGSEDDDVPFIDMVEKAGATIVVDDHCTGSRYFWNNVEDGSNLLRAIAERYVSRTPCPTKDFPHRVRFDRILQMARDYNVAGAIVIQQKFCDPHECDKVPLLKMLEENGIKTLYLEFDVTTPVGPFRIRVDAFLETLADEDLFG